MPLGPRLRRLEHTACLIAATGPACAICANGTKPHAVVARFQDRNLDEPIPLCPGCGRNNAQVIRVLRAVPPAGWFPRPFNEIPA